EVGDAAYALLEREKLTVEEPGAEVIGRPLGAVVAVGVRAAVAGADDHVGVRLRLGTGLDPLRSLAVPHELRLQTVGYGQHAHDVGRVDAPLLGDLRDALADGRGIARRAVDEDTAHGGRGERRALRAVGV